VPDLRIDAPAGALRAHLSRPGVAAGPWPAVVVIHDIFGLGDNVREHAGRLAAAGYLALAPDLYSRGGRLRCVRTTLRSLLSGEGDAYDDLEACRSWLAGQPDGNGRVGVIGFCLGGGFALMTASRGFQAAAPNYGPIPRHLDVLDGACPVVASFGARDRSLRGAATVLEVALRDRGVIHDIEEYPDAGHGFMDRYNVGPVAPLLRVAGLGYDAGSAEDAWNRILRFFAQHLGSGRP